MKAIDQAARGLVLDEPDYAGSEATVRDLGPPQTAVVALRQHVGVTLAPEVEVGERVLAGQVLARSTDYMSVPVHAPTSGTVAAIGDLPVPHPSGLDAPAVVIEADGEDEHLGYDPVGDYTRLAPSALRNVIREAGIVGMGGAGFPTFIKMNPGKDAGVQLLVINAVECEPLISCDRALLQDSPQDIVGGARILQHALGARRCVIAVKRGRSEGLAAMKDVAGGDIEVIEVPPLYPAGDERQLLLELSGREVPAGGLPIHIGAAVQNVATAAAVHRAVARGEPLISRIVTVTGGGVRAPRNLRVRIGTPMADLLADRQWDADNTAGLIMGGPMMGFALHTPQVPVIKTTNCIIAATARELPAPREVMPCIHCAACAEACPVNLLPQELYRLAAAHDFEHAEKASLFDCIECGCCAYVCPSNIPLVHYYRFAKTEMAAIEHEHQRSNIARYRFEFRNQRLEREKAEREARLQRRRRSLDRDRSGDGGGPPQKAAISEAVARAEARRQESEDQPSPADSGPSE